MVGKVWPVRFGRLGTSGLGRVRYFPVGLCSAGLARLRMLRSARCRWVALARQARHGNVGLTRSFRVMFGSAGLAAYVHVRPGPAPLGTVRQVRLVVSQFGVAHTGPAGRARVGLVACGAALCGTVP